MTDDVASPAGASPAGASPAGASPAGASPAGASPAGASPAGESQMADKIQSAVSKESDTDSPIILPSPPPVVDQVSDDKSGIAKPGIDEPVVVEPMVPLSKPLTDEEKRSVVDDFVTPNQVAADAFAAPPSAKQISGRNLWVDRENSRVYADGYVAMRDGPLEMFACSYGTKEHESIVSVIAKASEVHAGLLAVGAQQGEPVRVFPEYKAATGQAIRIWVTYRDTDGKFQVVDARQWIRTDDAVMDVDWVFAGSKIWEDPETGDRYYTADGGDMICVSNFSTAMLDVPVESSAQADMLMYEPNTPLIPVDGTAVRLVLQPIGDDGATEPPGEEMLPTKPKDEPAGGQ